MYLSLYLFCLGFAKFLGTLSLSLSPNLGTIGPLFLQKIFTPFFLVLSLDASYLSVRPFNTVSKVTGDLFVFNCY